MIFHTAFTVHDKNHTMWFLVPLCPKTSLFPQAHFVFMLCVSVSLFPARTWIMIMLIDDVSRIFVITALFRWPSSDDLTWRTCSVCYSRDFIWLIPNCIFPFKWMNSDEIRWEKWIWLGSVHPYLWLKCSFKKRSMLQECSLTSLSPSIAFNTHHT